MIGILFCSSNSVKTLQRPIAAMLAKCLHTKDSSEGVGVFQSPSWLCLSHATHYFQGLRIVLSLPLCNLHTNRAITNFGCSGTRDRTSSLVLYMLQAVIRYVTQMVKTSSIRPGQGVVSGPLNKSMKQRTFHIHSQNHMNRPFFQLPMQSSRLNS